MSGNSRQPRKFCVTPHEQQIQQRQQHFMLQQTQQQQQLPQQQQQQPQQQQQLPPPPVPPHMLQPHQQQHQQLLTQLVQQQRARLQRAHQLQQQQQQLAMQQGGMPPPPEQCGAQQRCCRPASPPAMYPGSYKPLPQQNSMSQTSGTSPPAPGPPPPPPLTSTPIKSELCSSMNVGHRSNLTASMRAPGTSIKFSPSTVMSSTQLVPQERSLQQQQQLVEQEPCGSGDSAKINAKLNEIFIKRLKEIDSEADGDPDLKLVTYQEWIDMLLKINDAIINNMEDLETEVTERLECVQRKASMRHCQEISDASKYRKDICTLLKIIQNGYHHDDWNLQGLQFETLRPEQVLGTNTIQNIPSEGPRNSIEQEAAQKNKLICNMKALAIEVAEKHDEICELRRQIFCMEDEIQNAQMKIQLKDNVIKELRNDLKCANSKLAAFPQNSSSTVTIVAMPPINSPRNICDQISESARDQMPYVLADDLSQFETLSQTEQLEQQKLKVLECELNELFEMTKDMKKQNYELHKKRLSDIFQKSESEKIEAYRKLDFIRRQLIELEAKQTGEQTANSSAANSSAANSTATNWNECDSGFSSKSENDRDAKMLEGVRKRIQKLNDCSFELKKKVQQLEIENNELLSKLQMEQSFVQRNSETLKQVADLLCNMTGEQFSYNDIYNVQNNGNPFCDAILRLEHARHQREEQLCQNVDKLQECLFNNEKEIISLEQRLNAKDVGTDAFKCQIEQLQCTIYEKENRIKQLNTMLNRLSHLRVESPSGQQQQQQSGTSQQQHQHGDQQSKHQQCELKMLQEKIEQLKCRNKKLCEDLENSQKQEHFLHTETRKLNDELTDSKRRNNELNMQTRRLTNLLKQQECHREEVTQKYQMIERNYEDQAKKLRHAHAQIKQLQDRFCMMEKLNDEHHMERNLLREEVLALKEKEACLLGKHKSIQEQLKKAEHEVFTAHGIIKEQQCIMQRNEVAHQESVKQLQEQSNETKRHFNMVVEDYNCLQEEYEKQNELRRQNEKVIESFRKWKEAQLKSDEATRASFKQYEEHIRLLLEEKQQFLEKYRDLNRDFCIMKNEVDRLHGVRSKK